MFGNNTILSNIQIKEEIKRENRNYFELNETKDTIY